MNEINGEMICGHGSRLTPALYKHGKQVPPKIRVGRYKTKQYPMLPIPYLTIKLAGQNRTQHISWRVF